MRREPTNLVPLWKLHTIFTVVWGVLFLILFFSYAYPVISHVDDLQAATCSITNTHAIDTSCCTTRRVPPALCTECQNGTDVSRMCSAFVERKLATDSCCLGPQCCHLVCQPCLQNPSAQCDCACTQEVDHEEASVTCGTCTEVRSEMRIVDGSMDVIQPSSATCTMNDRACVDTWMSEHVNGTTLPCWYDVNQIMFTDAPTYTFSFTPPPPYPENRTGIALAYTFLALFIAHLLYSLFVCKRTYDAYREEERAPDFSTILQSTDPAMEMRPWRDPVTGLEGMVPMPKSSGKYAEQSSHTDSDRVTSETDRVMGRQDTVRLDDVMTMSSDDTEHAPQGDFVSLPTIHESPNSYRS